MKKLTGVLLLFFFAVKANSLDISEFLKLSTFHYRMAAYNGAEYYPERKNKQIQYQEKLLLDFGWKYYLPENSTIWIDLAYNDELLDKQLILKSTGISHKLSSWELSYLYSPLEYGNRSHLFRLNVNHRYYDKPVLIDYRFQGIRLNKMFPEFTLSASGGGNRLNSALGNFSLTYHSHNFMAEIFCLYSGRNDFLNERTVSLGTELVRSGSSLFFYSAALLSLQTESQTERLDSIQEIIFYPWKTVYLGYNLVHSIVKWKKDRNWASRNILGFDIKRFSFILSYEYQNTEGEKSRWGNRKNGFLTSLKISKNIDLGLDLNYFNPTYAATYYQIGLQGKISYEIN